MTRLTTEEKALIKIKLNERNNQLNEEITDIQNDKFKDDLKAVKKIKDKISKLSREKQIIDNKLYALNNGKFRYDGSLCKFYREYRTEAINVNSEYYKLVVECENSENKQAVLEILEKIKTLK